MTRWMLGAKLDPAESLTTHDSPRASVKKHLQAIDSARWYFLPGRGATPSQIATGSTDEQLSDVSRWRQQWRRDEAALLSRVFIWISKIAMTK